MSVAASGGGFSAAEASARATPVHVVQVVGTEISTALDASRRFTLAGVPAGNVQLRFSGPSTDATLALGAVQSGDTVSLLVAVHGSQAMLVEDSRHPNAGLTPINGDAISLNGSPDAFEFRVNGQLIRGDAQTEFFGDGDRPMTFAEFLNLSRVEVKALPREGYFYAVRIHVNRGSATVPPTSPPPPSTPPQDSSSSIEGLLTSLTGSVPTLQLVVAGVTVRTSAGTEVQRRGDRQDLSTLRLGMTLHVVGDRQTNGSIDARRIQIKDDETGGAFEIEGSLGGMHGSCPAITFGVNGFSIAATSATVFTPPCSELKNGNKVRVRGTRLADGTVRATEVTRP